MTLFCCLCLIQYNVFHTCGSDPFLCPSISPLELLWAGPQGLFLFVFVVPNPVLGTQWAVCTCYHPGEESWVLKNWCFWTVVLEKTLGSPLDCKEIQPVHPKGYQSWVFIGRTDAEAETPILLAIWCEEVTHWKRPWCWEGLVAGGEGDDRGWDGWMASPTWWTWAWVSSGSWWWTGRPGVLQSMGSQSRTRLSNWTACLPSRSLRPALLMVVSRNTVSISLKTQMRKRFSLHTLIPSVSFYSSFTSLKVTCLHVLSSWYLHVMSHLIFKMCFLMHPARQAL